MAQAILPLSVIPACLQAIEQVSKSGSWKARASVLGLLQVHLLTDTLNTYQKVPALRVISSFTSTGWLQKNASPLGPPIVTNKSVY